MDELLFDMRREFVVVEETRGGMEFVVKAYIFICVFVVVVCVFICVDVGGVFVVVNFVFECGLIGL